MHGLLNNIHMFKVFSTYQGFVLPSNSRPLNEKQTHFKCQVTLITFPTVFTCKDTSVQAYTEKSSATNLKRQKLLASHFTTTTQGIDATHLRS